MSEAPILIDPADDRRGGTPRFPNKTILTPTGGFLGPSFTHTLNTYQGCAFAQALCGTFCYAQQIPWISKGRPWGLYAAKANVVAAYQRDHDAVRHRAGQPLRIFMSSITDPYLPQESGLRLTRSLLEAMLERPPDTLVIQSHSTLVRRDLELIEALRQRCELWLSLTVETDMDPVPGFPPHASAPSKRIEVLQAFRQRGIPTQAAISPLLPLVDPSGFARRLEAACDRVILDHYLIGDGSPTGNGQRTRRLGFEQRLIDQGFAEWTRLDKLWMIRDLFRDVMGANRVLIGCEGFNAVGKNDPGSRSPSHSTR